MVGHLLQGRKEENEINNKKNRISGQHDRVGKLRACLFQRPHQNYN